MQLITRMYSKLKRIRDYIKDRLLYKCLNYTTDKRKGFIKKVLLNIITHRRKVIGFYGECHIYVYGAYLSSNRELRKGYCLLGAKEIEYLVRWHPTEIQRKTAWDKLDVLIYNPGVPIRKGAPSLNDVLGWVPETCKKIEVTNAAFKGYMPQHTERVFKNDAYFIWGDKNINKFIENRASYDSLKELCNTEYYDNQYVNDFFDKSVKRMKKYERQCTVKIADYIEAHGRERILYYSVTHPEDEVMREITVRILRELGFKSGNKVLGSGQNGFFDLHSHGEVVYPSVYKGLGIQAEFNKRRIQPGNYKELTYSFDEYVREYYRMGKEIVDAGV